MTWYLYILQSELNKMFYVGISPHLEQRLEFHNHLGHGFTSRYRPWKLVYSKEYPTRQLGQVIEKKIKARKSKEYISGLLIIPLSLDQRVVGSPAPSQWSGTTRGAIQRKTSKPAFRGYLFITRLIDSSVPAPPL